MGPLQRLVDRFWPRPDIEALAQKGNIEGLNKALRHSDSLIRRRAAIVLLSRFGDALRFQSLGPQPDLREWMALSKNTDWDKFLHAVTMMVYLVPDPEDRQAMLDEASRLAQDKYKEDIVFSVDPRNPRNVLVSESARGKASAELTGRANSAASLATEDMAPHAKQQAPIRTSPTPTEADRLSDSGMLRAFLDRMRGAWNHERWLGLLSDVRRAAYTTLSDDDIGRLLECEKAKWHRERDTQSGSTSTPESKAEARAVRFRDNGDGTVSDTRTGLNWQQSDDGEGRTYTDALSYCRALCLAGHSDWRLPSVEELKSIVVVGTASNVDNVFVNAKREIYWTRSEFPEQPDIAYTVDFADGGETSYFKFYKYYVRAVRG